MSRKLVGDFSVGLTTSAPSMEWWERSGVRNLRVEVRGDRVHCEYDHFTGHKRRPSSVGSVHVLSRRDLPI